MPEPRDRPEIRVPVPLGPRSYSIRVVSGDLRGVGRFAREALDATWAGKACRLALLVTDQNLAAFPYVRAVGRALAEVGIACETVVLPPGEATKSLDSAALLYDQLIAMKADRHTVVVALGRRRDRRPGRLRRGHLRPRPAPAHGPHHACWPRSTARSAARSASTIPGPRTSSAPSTSRSASGSTPTCSSTLPAPRAAVRPGRGGQVRRDPRRRLLRRARRPGRGHPRSPGDALRRIVAHCCRLKADVVAQDEREETGLRAVLNFGHTVGHAIEAVAGYAGAYQHGEAVAAGMVAECRLAERLGWIDAGTDRPPDRPARAVRPADRDPRARSRPAPRGHEPRQEEPARADPVRPPAQPRARRADRRAAAPSNCARSVPVALHLTMPVLAAR